MKFISISDGQLLLLKAALNNNRNIALNAWRKWIKNSSIETAPDSELRILPSVYNNISKLNPSASLPIKINGQMKHIYTKNYLHLDVVLKLSKLFKKKNINIIFGKGINICQRFNLFSTRRMGDIDFYINENQFIKACNILEKDSWTLTDPMRMTWDCLTGRFLTRGKSINVTKNYNGIDVQIDLHWRLYTTEKNSELYKQKMNMAEATKIKNQIIYLDNIEFATLNSIEHGIFTGVDSSDQSQMILDLAKLLPASNKKKLLNLLNKSSFLKYNKNISLFFTELKSIYKKIGLDIKVPEVRINLLNNTLFIINNIFRNDNHKVSTFNNSFLRRIITNIKLILFSENEKSLVNYPLKYFFWRILFNLSFFEKIIIKLYGPMSKTNNPKKVYFDSYNFYNCAMMKLVGGPGWAYPFKSQNDDGFWGDRTDCRMLFFLEEKENYKISIFLSKLQNDPIYLNIKVYANGFFLGKISNNFDSNDFIIYKNFLTNNWVEISLRTNLINNSLTVPLHKINLKKTN
jgi:hypothetical protein